MTRRYFYFILCIGLLVFNGIYDLHVSAQELGDTNITLGFGNQEESEAPDNLFPSEPERIPNEETSHYGRLPQLNQQTLYWIMYSGALGIFLVIFYLTRKKSSYYKEGF